MQLVYLWVEKFRNIEQEGFLFSPDYNVNFNLKEPRSLSVRKTKELPISFGKKITNVSAIIGENGSGKTNIMDLLGFRMTDRMSFANREAEYFLLYHLNDNFYVIEGRGLEKFGFITTTKRVQNLFSIVASVSNENEWTFERFLQENQENGLNNHLTFVSFRQKYDRTYWRGRSFELENEPYYFFQRYAFNGTGLTYSKYKFMKNAILREEASTTVSTKQKMGNSNNNFKVSPQASLIIEPNLGRNSESTLELKLSSRTLFGFKSSLHTEPLTEEQKKILFISSMLEDIARDIYRGCIEDFSENAARINGNINGIVARKKNPIKYFLDVLNKLGDIWDRLVPTDSKFYDSILQLTNLIKKLPSNMFAKDQIIIHIKNDEVKSVKDLLEHIDKIKMNGNNHTSHLLGVSVVPLSSGEEAFLNMYSSVLYAASGASNANETSCILLLDEPDGFMHPEWSRNMINEIINNLENLEVGYKNYQILITTHSPFIISDLPQENLIALKKDLLTGRTCKEESAGFNQTFAANIHTLLTKEFFMRDTIGSFAKRKITEVMLQMQKLLNRQIEERDVDKEQLREFINLIGEPLIREKMLELYSLALPGEFRKLQVERLNSLRKEATLLEKWLEDN